MFGVVVECNENIDKVRANSGAQQVNSLGEVLEQKEMFLGLQKLPISTDPERNIDFLRLGKNAYFGSQDVKDLVMTKEIFAKYIYICVHEQIFAKAKKIP